MAYLEWFYSLPLRTVDFGPRELGAAVATLLTGRVKSTEPVRRLEAAIQRLIGAREAIAFENGRTALRWILELTKAVVANPERNQVLMPALLCKSVLNAALAAGLNPVLCDVTDDLAMDPSSAEEIYDPDKTLAVIVPHLYGIPSPVHAVRAFTEPAGTVLIDDAAAAMGSVVSDVPLGLQGDAGLFSFAQGKAASAGGGGMLVLPESSPFLDTLADRAVLLPAIPARARSTFLRFFWFDVLHRISDPLETAWKFVKIYLKSGGPHSESNTKEYRRMAGLQANVALVQTERLKSMRRRRFENFEILRKDLDDLAALRIIDQPAQGTHTRFLVETLEQKVVRDKSGIRQENPLVTHLRKSGIEARYVYLPLHRYKGGGDLPATGLDRSERLSDRLVHLPFLPPLGRGELARVSKAVRSFFGK